MDDWGKDLILINCVVDKFELNLKKVLNLMA